MTKKNRGKGWLEKQWFDQTYLHHKETKRVLKAACIYALLIVFVSQFWGKASCDV